jgi:hypothetical protein
MSTTLDEYRNAKNTYLKLKGQAKKELIARFNELASALFEIQRELLEDFGEKVAMPAKPKKSKPARRAAAPAPAAPAPPAEEPAAPSPKVLAIQKQIESQKKKLAAAQTAGKQTRPIEDRLYELEDALRLLEQK